MLGMPNCREATRLVSESKETELGFGKRVGLWMHLSMCQMCKGFAAQLRVLQNAVRMHGDSPLSLNDASLPESARERIRHAVEDTQSSGE